MTDSTLSSMPLSCSASDGQTATHAPHWRHKDRSSSCADLAVCSGHETGAVASACVAVTIWFASACAAAAIRWTPAGQTAAQRPHEVQRFRKNISSGVDAWVSGLWHQLQRKEHPLKKTVVRIPGPSPVEKCCSALTWPVMQSFMPGSLIEIAHTQSAHRNHSCSVRSRMSCWMFGSSCV